MTTPKRAWVTADELRYLSTIGQNSKTEQLVDQETCLTGYLQAAKSRTDWGDINPVACIAKAGELLAMAREPRHA